MMREAGTLTVRRRISVLLGCGTSCRAVLEALAPLLEREPGADLLALLVEDSELEAAAELPFVKELSRLTSSAREFQASDARRELARRMRDAQSHLELAASRVGASPSLRNVRGSVLALLREALASSDITFFEPLRASTLMRLQAEPRPPLRRIAVVLTATLQDRGVLEAAFELAQRRPERLALLLTPVAAEHAEHIEQDIARTLPRARRLVDRLPDDTVGAVIAAVQRLGAGCLVLPASESLLETDALRLLRERLSCPVVVVRPPPDS